jgi:hypothetical protein
MLHWSSIRQAFLYTYQIRFVFLRKLTCTCFTISEDLFNLISDFGGTCQAFACQDQGFRPRLNNLLFTCKNTVKVLMIYVSLFTCATLLDMRVERLMKEAATRHDV